MKRIKEIDRDILKLNWFQISNTLKLGYYDRELVRVKYEDKSMSESEWRELLKKEGVKF